MKTITHTQLKTPLDTGHLPRRKGQNILECVKTFSGGLVPTRWLGAAPDTVETRAYVEYPAYG